MYYTLYSHWLFSFLLAWHVISPSPPLLSSHLIAFHGCHFSPLKSEGKNLDKLPSWIELLSKIEWIFSIVRLAPFFKHVNSFKICDFCVHTNPNWCPHSLGYISWMTFHNTRNACSFEVPPIHIIRPFHFNDGVVDLLMMNQTVKYWGFPLLDKWKKEDQRKRWHLEEIDKSGQASERAKKEKLFAY